MTIKYFTEENSVQCVLDRMDNCKDERFKEIMAAAIKHLHAFVKEVELTQDEWAVAIDFLTKTGQKCDDRRQEFILLSDTTGVSMLVDAINHRKPGGATENTVLGPFHVAGAPHRQMGDNICLDGKGEPMFMDGRVLDTEGKPIAGATLDIWHSNDDGFYDVQQPGIQPDFNLRGIFTTGADGRYWFRSIKPEYYPIPTDGPVGVMLKKMGRHPFRPAHVHVILTAPGYDTITTHIFVRGDRYLESDAVFGVKESLIEDFTQHDDPRRAAELGLGNPFWTITHDFVMTKVPEGAAPRRTSMVMHAPER
jgi:catechol 1,2-dioxygenase